MINFRIQSWPLIFVFSLFFLFTSCEEIANEVLGEAIDCIFPHKPELRGEIPNGKVDEPYSGIITASIKNSPDEDAFDYVFELMGSLPEGVQYTVFDRNVRFSGKPQESGTFRFAVTVEIFDTREDSDDGTCLGNNTTTEEYVMIIQP
ncbi:MAG: hypothetical protein WBV45_06910 [Lutimonas sp.]